MQDLIHILSANRTKNISLINFIRQYGIDSVDRIGDSLMVRGFSDRSWVFFSSANQVEFNELTQKLIPDDLNFASLEDWMLPSILKHGELQWKLSCYMFYCPEEFVLNKNTIHHVVPVVENEAYYIFKHYEYSQFAKLDYIKERLRNGPAFGIYHQDQLAAFILTHDDGAIGFLTVLPQCRGKGLAKDLIRVMTWKLRENGDLPFVQIEEENYQSINLVRQFGYLYEKKIHWVGLQL